MEKRAEFRRAEGKHVRMVGEWRRVADSYAQIDEWISEEDGTEKRRGDEIG